MYKKIETKEQLFNLTKKSVVIKYPINDEPLSSFEDANSENIVMRIVSNNYQNLEEIEFVLLDQKIDQKIISGLDSILFGPIKTTYQDIINNGKYWIKQ
jgi:hypothetical protein